MGIDIIGRVIKILSVIGSKLDTIFGDSLVSLAKLGNSPYIICGTSPNTAGTANTATRIELDSNASAVDGTYDPATVYILSGAGVGQARQIFEYDGINKYAYVNRDWKFTPDDTSVYCIVMNPGNTHVNEGVAQGGGNATITLNTLASDQNNLYLGQLVFIIAGAGQDQARMVVGYNGTTKVATVDADWIINPDTTSVYMMLPYPGFVHGVPTPDSVANILARDIIGNKTDAESLAAATASLVALARMGAKEAWEVEQHFHTGQLGFGIAAVPDGELHVADRVGTGAAGAEAAPFICDAGNDDWGTWTQVMGSSDTPPSEIPTATHYDMRFIKVVASENDDQRYMLQFVVQEDAPADDPGVGDYFTETETFIHDAAVQGDPTMPIIEFPNYRRPVATKMWARSRAPNLNTSTLSFYLYGHFYIDPE